MEPPGVLVVGETPSLGRSIVDLLESEGVPARYTDELPREGTVASRGGRFPVVVAASNGHYCATARQWGANVGAGTALIVVGSRDPYVPLAHIELVALPLVPSRFLLRIRSLLDAAEGRSPSTTAPSS